MKAEACLNASGVALYIPCTASCNGCSVTGDIMHSGRCAPCGVMITPDSGAVYHKVCRNVDDLRDNAWSMSSWLSESIFIFWEVTVMRASAVGNGDSSQGHHALYVML